MDPSVVKLSRIVLVVTVMIVMLFQSHNAMQYNEPLNVEELERMFLEDDCIEGSLSTFQSDGPVFKYVSVKETNFAEGKMTGEESIVVLEKENSTMKSPLSLLHELASFNKVTYQYDLIDEKGPAHKKTFVISLLLGKEEYQGEGDSIKKAQREAARLALNSTSLVHPPQKFNEEKSYEHSKTSVQKLSDWVNKHSGNSMDIYYYEQSFVNDKSLSNYYHSPISNLHKVCIKISEKEFIGEGTTPPAAKEAAARKALDELQHLQGMCLFSDSERNIISKLLNLNSAASPVSLINEYSSKSKVTSRFDLTSEEGPAHIKKFTYKCSVGDFNTYGEGSSKKEAKTDAAEKMVKLLRSEAENKAEYCETIFDRKKKQKKRNKKLIKSFTKSKYQEEDNNIDISLPNELDPVSKLYQVQQRRGDVEPVFRLLKEKGHTNEEFLMEVIVGDQSFVGSGANKKTAKKNAAEGILNKMGYTKSQNKPDFSVTEKKKLEFNKKNIQNIGSSVNLDSGKIPTVEKDKSPVSARVESSEQKSIKKSPMSGSKSEKPQSKNDQKSPTIQPKKQLKALADQLGLRYQFSDFPGKNNIGFVSLLSISSKPPKICYGVGETIDFSQDRAALSALENLYKNQLETISRILVKPTDNDIKEEIMLKKPSIKPFVKPEKD